MHKKQRVLTVRMTDQDYNDVLLRAELYCDGNVSEWARHCLASYSVIKRVKKTPAKRKAQRG